MALRLLVVWLWFVVLSSAWAQTFQFPTANHALLERGGWERFFTGTAGRTWESGMFGCVRSGGWQMHEGIDIASVQRDRKGEPTDPVLAAADGTVAYINARPGLSNYGNYLLLRHELEGVEIYTNYAHLREIAAGLKAGVQVKAGDVIGVLGRTANTRQPITKDRAHLHFEIALLKNDRFAEWYRQEVGAGGNDHGNWNGQNLAGLDPTRIFLAQREQGEQFSLLRFIREQDELCRVQVRATDFSWLRRYTPLIRRNPAAERDGVEGYELALNFNGIPFQLTPRSAAEMEGKGRYQVLSVNEPEAEKNRCRRLLTKKGEQWQLTEACMRLLDLLTY